MVEETTKNILEDPSIYEYDSMHDDIVEARKQVEEEKKKDVR